MSYNQNYLYTKQRKAVLFDKTEVFKETVINITYFIPHSSLKLLSIIYFRDLYSECMLKINMGRYSFIATKLDQIC